MSRNAYLLTGGLVVAAAILFGGAWWLLSRNDTSEEAVAEEGQAPDGPVVKHLPPAESLRDRHMFPYPFGDFAKDIAAIRKPGKKEVFLEYKAREVAVSEFLLEKRISITMKDTPRNVIAQIQKECAGSDIEVLTGPPYLPDFVEVDIDMKDALLQEIVMEMNQQTQERVTYRISPLGFTIGTKNACVQANLDALEWEREQRRTYSQSTRDDPLLNETYRPDLRDAHIGAVARDIKQKTGVETIIGPELWEKAVKLTWKSDPMRLEAALDELTERLECHWYVKDGRVFLLAR